MIKVRFPDGNELSYDEGITPFEIAEKISPSLAGASSAGSKSFDQLESGI